MRKTLSYIWQLPQNLLGLLLRVICKGDDIVHEGVIVRTSDRMLGGISLGHYIILHPCPSKDTVLHEYGHCRQSQKLGWLYLPVIGLPSIIWAALYGDVIQPSPNGYYEFYTERWADKLGGVSR